MRLLILACTATKRPDPGLLPALERYDGPSARTLRKALREFAEVQHPAIVFLSARYGLLSADTPIPDYNQLMTPAQARILQTEVWTALCRHLDGRSYQETFINVGAAYALALPIDATIAVGLGTITYAHGGIGTRLGQMRRWLAGGGLPTTIPTQADQ